MCWAIVIDAAPGAAVCAGPVKYTVTEIPAPSGYSVIRPVGLNNAGQVAAFCSDWSNLAVGIGVLHTPGIGLRELTTPALQITNPIHINDAGQVFGDTDPDGSMFGQEDRTLWRYSDGVGVQTLEIPPEIARFGWFTDVNNVGGACGGMEIGFGEQRGWVYSDAQGWRRSGDVSPVFDAHGKFVAINDAGDLAGVFEPSANSFLFQPALGAVNIGNLGVPVTFVADGAITASGRLAGSSSVEHPTHGIIGRAVRYTPGVGLLNLHSVNEEYWTAAHAINSAGMVAGTVYDVAGPNFWAFRYDDAHGMVTITPPPAPFGLAVLRMNEDGQVLGASYGDLNEPWVWNPTDGAVPLRPYYDPAGSFDVMGYPVDMNDAGQILLYVLDLKGEVGRSIVLTPELCYADCNADRSLTVADFGCFQTRFVGSDPYADCNGDGQRTVADFGCFQTRFVSGCP